MCTDLTHRDCRAWWEFICLKLFRLSVTPIIRISKWSSDVSKIPLRRVAIPNVVSSWPDVPLPSLSKRKKESKKIAPMSKFCHFSFITVCRKEVDSPWSWLVCICATIIVALFFGVSLSFGVMFPVLMEYFQTTRERTGKFSAYFKISVGTYSIRLK